MPARIVEREVVRGTHWFLDPLAFVDVDASRHLMAQQDTELNAVLRDLAGTMREWHRCLAIQNGDPDPYGPPPPSPWWRRALRAVGVGRA